MRRASHKSGAFSKVGALVGASLNRLGLRSRVTEHQAVRKWAEVVGPQIASCTTAERIRDGILFVSCKSSMWANELSLQKAEILKRLRKTVGARIVKDVRFSARGFRPESRSAEKEDDSGVEDLDAIPLSAEEIKAARRVASASPSRELAERVERAFLTVKRLAALKRKHPGP